MTTKATQNTTEGNTEATIRVPQKQYHRTTDNNRQTEGNEPAEGNRAHRAQYYRRQIEHTQKQIPEGNRATQAQY
jgi:hypothetical protein